MDRNHWTTSSEYAIGEFSPNLEYIEWLDVLSVVDLTSGEIIHVNGVDACGLLPSWSPDSKRIISICSENNGISDLYLISLDTRLATRLLKCNDGEHFCSDPSWSPDGKWIAYYYSILASGQWDETGLYILNTQCFDTTSACAIQGMGEDATPPYTWSPDSQYLAGRCEDDSINIYLIEDGNLVLSRNYQIGMYFSIIAWSPSGKWIAVNSADGVLLVSVESGEIMPLTNLGEFYSWISVP